MISIIQQLRKTSDPDAFCDIASVMKQSMRIHFHCKDLRGQYVNCNDQVMFDTGVSNKKDIIGRTDFDFEFLADDEATSFREADSFVIKSKKNHFLAQHVTLADGEKYIALNEKSPLTSLSKKVIGIASFGFLIRQGSLFRFDPSSPMLNLIFSMNYVLLEILTKRQVDCLYYLVKGLSIKEIAQKLSLSHRTVENYINTIKTKLDCRTRADLVDKVLRHPFR